jgi:hypothetical protein
MQEKAGRRSQRPILVTGAYRSGTTWVGRMLALSPRIGYINEPFNPTIHQPGVCSATFPLAFKYVSDDEERFRAPLEAMLRFRYQLKAQLRSVKTREELEQSLREGWIFLRSRSLGARPLVKDPFAAFSAGWLASTFNMDTVIVVRHPAAFAASVKRLGWQAPFEDLLAQPALIRDLLADFEAPMRRMERESDPMDRSALMWLMIYSALLRLSDDHADWIFVRHEDLAMDPVPRFSELFSKLGLRSTPRIDRRILWYSSGPREAERDAPAYEFRRHSRDTISTWRTRLTEDEQKRLRARVGPLAERFYSDRDW